MSLFNFLKNLVKNSKEETVKINEIKLENLKEWIDEHYKTATTEISKQLAKIKSDIDDEKIILSEKLKKLEKAELKNNTINERIKQIMLGNRETFLQKLNSHSERIAITDNIEELKKFLRDYEKKMKEFETSISKSYQVMSEFFPQETGDVARAMKTLDKHVAETKILLEQSKIVDLEKIKLELRKILERVMKKNELDNSTSENKKKLDLLSAMGKQKANELKKIKDSEENKKLIKLKSEFENIQNEKNKVEGEIFHIFSSVESALKKYEKASENKIVQKYIKNPIMALKEDAALEITAIIDNLKKSILRGEIDLKDKKKDKTFKGLGRLSREYFEEFNRTISNLEDNLNHFNDEIKKINVFDEIKKIKKELDDLQTEILNLNKKISDAEKELSGIDIAKDVEILESEISDKISRVKILMPI